MLVALTSRAGTILGDSFVGAYVHGSFAVGDADTHSDCDFLIPVNRPITADQEDALRALHDEIPTRGGHWTKHVEGSYPHLNELASLRGLGARWLYIDDGWREMPWSTHCNTEVVRWTLREHGVTLTGPQPKTLLDPVPAEALMERMRQQIPTAVDDTRAWISLDIAWAQRYVVTTLCRMLYTLETGQVTPKLAALRWASDTLEAGWRPLLQQVREDRALGFDVSARPRPGSVASTLAFADHARALAEGRAPRGTSSRPSST